MKNSIVALVIPTLLAGCATTANYENLLNTWVGNHVDSLVSSWGPPRSSFQLSDGGKVIEYANSRNIQIGGYTTTVPQTTYNSGTANAYGSGGYAYGSYSGTSTTYVQQTTPVQNIAMQCITRFTIDPQGIITKWSWQGNDCKARNPN